MNENPLEINTIPLNPDKLPLFEPIEPIFVNQYKKVNTLLQKYMELDNQLNNEEKKILRGLGYIK